MTAKDIDLVTVEVCIKICNAKTFALPTRGDELL